MCAGTSAAAHDECRSKADRGQQDRSAAEGDVEPVDPGVDLIEPALDPSQVLPQRIGVVRRELRCGAAARPGTGAGSGGCEVLRVKLGRDIIASQFRGLSLLRPLRHSSGSWNDGAGSYLLVRLSRGRPLCPRPLRATFRATPPSTRPRANRWRGASCTCRRSPVASARPR